MRAGGKQISYGLQNVIFHVTDLFKIQILSLALFYTAMKPPV
jgi:hypothetical protein